MYSFVDCNTLRSQAKIEIDRVHKSNRRIFYKDVIVVVDAVCTEDFGRQVISDEAVDRFGPVFVVADINPGWSRSFVIGVENRVVDDLAVSGSEQGNPVVMVGVHYIVFHYPVDKGAIETADSLEGAPERLIGIFVIDKQVVA